MNDSLLLVVCALGCATLGFVNGWVIRGLRSSRRRRRDASTDRQDTVDTTRVEPERPAAGRTSKAMGRRSTVAATAGPSGSAVKTGPPLASSAGARTAARGADEGDLEIVAGIDAAVAEALRSAGMGTLSTLARTPISQLRQVLTAAGLAHHDPTSWPRQAGLAARGRWDELRSLQHALGRPS